MRWFSEVLLTFTVSAPPLFPQSFTGRILGTVRDPAGAVIPGASVTVTSLDTNRTIQASANVQGNYLGKVVDNRRILSLPLNSRNAYSLIYLTPGVTGGISTTYSTGQRVLGELDVSPGGRHRRVQGPGHQLRSRVRPEQRRSGQRGL